MKVKATIFLIILILLSNCNSDSGEIKTELIRPVKFAAVEQKGGEIQKTFNGTSQAGAETNLSFRTNGLITKINVKVGDIVKSGTLMAELELSDIDLNYQKAKAQLRSAKSQLETARSSFDRAKELYQSNSASLSDYEQAKNAYLGAQSNYEGAEKTEELQARQYEYAKIVAPINGVISQVNREINEFVTSGSPIFVINSNQEDIEVNIGVTEAYISRIKNGDKAKILFTGIANKTFEGVVTEVGFSSAQSATSPVVLKLLETSSEMRPGMPVEVTFSFGNKNEKSLLSVPICAVGEDYDGTFVYRLNQIDGKYYKVEKTKITVGKLGNYTFQVIEGLNEGDLVATAGLRTLFDGMKVQLLNK